MDKRVLITGATGFLGKYAIEEFLKSGYDVTAQGRNADRLSELSRKYKIDTLECGLDDIANKKKDVDCVVHAAALSTVWGKWEDFYSSNVEGTKNIIKFCTQNGVKRLIYVSSPSIYTEKRDRFDIKEDEYEAKNELNFYIKSKIAAEVEVNEAHKNGLQTVIIRPRGLFGIGDTSIIPRLIRANRTIGIPLFNEGKNVVDITCVENAALSLRLAAESENADGNTYNITNGEPTEFKAILEKLFDKLGEEPHYRKLPVNVFYSAACALEGIYKFFGICKEPPLTKYTVMTLAFSQTLNTEKAGRDMGYSPVLTLDEGIEKYAEFTKEQNNGC